MKNDEVIFLSKDKNDEMAIFSFSMERKYIEKWLNSPMPEEEYLEDERILIYLTDIYNQYKEDSHG